jgi:BirA family biotin operon repressor/biotin-[acetyl-CoA-carboxylase] ligase
MDAARERLQTGSVRLDDGLPTPFAGIVARQQTAGRGQRGRVWSSVPGASLCATFYLRHGLDVPKELGSIALLSGIAVAATLATIVVASSAPVDPGLKWPNDVLLNGKKVGGILIEMAQTTAGEAVALIGIGLNLTSGAFPPELASTATALEICGIRAPDPVVLAEGLAAALGEQAALFRAQGQQELVTRWRGWDRTAGRRFHTERDGVPIHGVAEGVDADGKLLLRLPDRSLLAVGSASTLQEALA